MRIPTQIEADVDTGLGRRVLLLASGRWVSTARLVMALAELGVEPWLMAAADHPALTVKALAGHVPYRPLRPVGSVREAIDRVQPSALIPVDELCVHALEELVATEDPEISMLVTHSLGSAQVLHAARARRVMHETAVEAGVAVPESFAVEDESQLTDVLRAQGVPLVLKADATSGGRGVRMVKTVNEAFREWNRLHEPPSLLRALKRGFVAQEWNHLQQWRKNEHRPVLAQRLVTGPERTAMAVAREGELLAAVSMEVVETWCVRGPSSVVRIIEDERMTEGIRRVVRRLGMTGFAGFDFIVDEQGAPLLIEMNPRPTQLMHLALGPGRDLVAAYARNVLGLEAVADRPAVTEKSEIAIFPLERERDPQSAWLERAFHDVPADEEALVKKVVG